MLGRSYEVILKDKLWTDYSSLSAHKSKDPTIGLPVVSGTYHGDSDLQLES